MPSETFLNLPAAKITAIEQILLEIFYDQPISQVRVSEIVAAMGMSRGAFYKYFRDIEDAYTFLVRKCSADVHQDILAHIHNGGQAFFDGIEDYLRQCSQLDHQSNTWKSLQLLTRSNDLSANRRPNLPPDSPLLTEWLALLRANNFLMGSNEEAVSFLYFVMALVMNSLTDFFANDWQTAQLLQDFHFKTHWLINGLKTK